jgi:hypothetical protein
MPAGILKLNFPAPCSLNEYSQWQLHSLMGQSDSLGYSYIPHPTHLQVLLALLPKHPQCKQAPTYPLIALPRMSRLSHYYLSLVNWISTNCSSCFCLASPSPFSYLSRSQRFSYNLFISASHFPRKKSKVFICTHSSLITVAWGPIIHAPSQEARPTPHHHLKCSIQMPPFQSVMDSIYNGR